MTQNKKNDFQPNEKSISMDEKDELVITNRKTLLISGLAALGMCFAAPFAEFYALGSLIIDDNPSETVSNILENICLLKIAVIVYIINIIFDLILAWGLYVLLKHVNSSLSLFTALLKVMYTAIFATSVSKLINVLSLLKFQEFHNDNRYVDVLFQVIKFKNGWNVAFIFFGISLMITGWLFYKEKNKFTKTSVLGITLIIAGIGYLVDSFAQILIPNFGINIAAFTFIGEFYLMIWLLWKGILSFKNEYKQ